jgi:lipoprotein-anchoring transpeptidase ErfK/SrfK
MCDSCRVGYDRGRDQQRASLSARWRTFVLRYGWRAYAIPILAVVTVVALTQSDPAGARSTHGVSADASSRGTGAVTHPKTTAPLAPVQAGTETDSTACLRNTVAKFVLVSISKQHVWMCQGSRQVYATAATTGEVADGDSTPLGSWVVQGRQTDRYLVGPGYRDYVHYWIPFNGDFGFHDATWQTMAFGSQGYKTKGSHGCVHLPMTAVAWLYHWAQPGSTVVTIQA